MCAQGFLLGRSDRLEESTRRLLEAHRLAIDAGATAVAALALGLANATDIQLSGDDVESHAEAAVRLARDSGDDYAIAQTVTALGIALTLRSPEAARERYREAADLADSIGDVRNSALFLCNVAGTDLMMERPEKAEPGAERAIATMRRLGDSFFEANATGLLTLSQAAQGQPERARATVTRPSRS